MSGQETDTWLETKIQIPVYYEDTDFTGFVYHANYLKYFERAREEMVGMNYLKELYERGIHYVVHKVELQYLGPAQHGDLIEVASRLRLSESPVSLVKQTAYKLDPNSGERQELVEGTIKLVAVDDDGAPIRIPEDVTSYFLSLKG